MSPHISLRPSARPEFNLQPIARADANPRLLAAASRLEQRFGYLFETFTPFPGDLLSELHTPGGDVDDLVADIQSVSHPGIAIEIGVLRETAAKDARKLGSQARQVYFEALLSIYKSLPYHAAVPRRNPRTLMVGIEREGRILAESLGWLPPDHSLAPHAKRIHIEAGLAVGLRGAVPQGSFDECVLVDGAIASGATLISMIDAIQRVVGCERYTVLSVHGTVEGIRAVLRFCSAKNLRLNLEVGYTTSGLNHEFYAVSEDGSSQIIGDVGDTIGPIWSADGKKTK